MRRVGFRLAIDAASSHLRRGGIVVYPTETSYAIGCDATNARAVQVLFSLKGRARTKSLPLIVASASMATVFAAWNTAAARIARRYWPGPVTLVLETARHGSAHGAQGFRRLAPGVRSPNGTVALRVPAHPIARALSRALGRPIVSTSANRAGGVPALTIAAATHTFARRAAHRCVAVAYIDGGTLPKRAPSTIVDCTTQPPHIVRPGTIRIARTWIS